jgi:hypothetical protein
MMYWVIIAVVTLALVGIVVHAAKERAKRRRIARFYDRFTPLERKAMLRIYSRPIRPLMREPETRDDERPTSGTTTDAARTR